jgi:hypothetical protein
MQCRMCSQRLTRPGRLCRECDQELARARALAAAGDGLSPVAPLTGASTFDDLLVSAARLTSPPGVVVVAFVVGIVAAIAVYSVERSHASGSGESVMIDRDLSKVRPREYRTRPSVGFTESAPQSQPQGQVSDDVRAARTVSARGTVARASERRSTVVFSTVASNAISVPANAEVANDRPERAVSAPAESAGEGYDRVLGLADALETCSHQPIFARVACEHRARGRYCDDPGASQIPQCADRPPRDYGQ